MAPRTINVIFCAALVAQFIRVSAAEAPEKYPSIDERGTVWIPSLAVPLSPHMSEQAKQRFIEQFKVTSQSAAEHEAHKGAENASPSGCPGREHLDRWHQVRIDRARAVYPVEIEKRLIGGVKTDVVTPRGNAPVRNRNRVLINLHGGSYSCATAGGLAGQLEAIPIAGAGQFEVIAIDYRTSPEHTFPAANEDVAAVYTELLNRYESENIGLYGCSTGATLSASSLAWFQKKQLPRPGAVGLFGSGATKDDHVDGDSWFINWSLTGRKPLGPQQSHQALLPSPYMKGVEDDDPLASPVVFREVLSQFPPALLITGTRDIALSETVYTHTQLIKAGVEADLHVWEGMGHCFFFDADIPESKEAYEVMAKFFDRHLGRSLFSKNKR